jgi:hypothetical protein
MLAGEGVGGVPLRGDRHCGTLDIYHVTSFTSPIGGPNKKSFKKRRTEHFGAPHLFSSQSPIKEVLRREIQGLKV